MAVPKGFRGRIFLHAVGMSSEPVCVGFKNSTSGSESKICGYVKIPNQNLQ